MLEKLIQYKAYNSKQQIKLRSTQLLSSQLTQVIFITLFIFSKPSLLVIISTSLTTYQYIQAFRRLFEDYCHSPLRCTQHWPNGWRFFHKNFLRKTRGIFAFYFFWNLRHRTHLEQVQQTTTYHICVENVSQFLLSRNWLSKVSNVFFKLFVPPY